MRVLILANGDIADERGLRAHLGTVDQVICADGGLLHAQRLGLAVNWLIGDMDSVNEAALASLGETTQVERYPAAKNETDLELALQKAATLGANAVLVAGAGGGRVDHALANILLLAQQRWPFALSFVEGQQLASVLHAHAGTLELTGAVGQLVSLLPLPQAEGVRTQGLAYPLTGETLAFGTPRGISNVQSAKQARVSLEQGTLLVIETPSD